jgi:hypothetical protein
LLVIFKLTLLNISVSPSEHRLKVFENRVLRKIFGRKRDEVKGEGEDYIRRSFMSCTRQILFG